MSELLKGVRVVDLTRAMAGPYGTMMLADHGAEVIKVESGAEGDGARVWPPYDDRGESLYFLSINRSKRSIQLDLRTDEGRDILIALIATADVLVENFRPGIMADMGLDVAALRARFPRLIVASISGFGSRGPDSPWPGLDQIAQGMSGLMSVTGTAETGPLRYGVPIIDINAGMFMAFGVAAALRSREVTGEGAVVETSLLEAAVALLTFQGQRYLSLGEIPAPTGNDHPVMAPYGVYRTSDSSITIAVANDGKWRQFAALLGAPELAERAEYRTAVDRLRNRATLTRDIEELLQVADSAEWTRRIRAAGIPAGPIHDLEHVFADPQVEAIGLVERVPADDGEVALVRSAVSVDGSPAAVRSLPPALGADTRALLVELGWSDERIDAAARDGVVGVRETVDR